MANTNIIRVRFKKKKKPKKFHSLIFFSRQVKHVLNPLGLAKYEIRQNNQVVADVK